MSFVERQIDLTIEYYKTGQTMRLTGHRVQLSLLAMPDQAGGQLSMRVYGLPLAVINELLAISNVANQAISKNMLHVEAGNAGEPLSRIFSGVIMHSWGDFSQPPDVNLMIEASVQGLAAMTVVPGYSHKGSISAADIMQGLATQAGFSFRNNGVTVMLSSPVFNGSLKNQMVRCAQQANIHYVIYSGTLIIYQKGPLTQIAGNSSIPILTPESGLVGYPQFTQEGIQIRSIFLPFQYPSSEFAIAGSQITAANRTWFTRTAIHTLESQIPGGSWFTETEAYAHV